MRTLLMMTVVVYAVGSYSFGDWRDLVSGEMLDKPSGTIILGHLGVPSPSQSLKVLGCHPDPDVRRTVAKHNALAGL